MATALAQYAEVLWVDPPLSPIASFRRGAATPPLRAWPTLSRIDDLMMRLTPRVLPFHTRPAMRPTSARLVRLQIHRALRRLHLHPRAIVASHLDDVLGGWGGATVSVLYGTDDYVAGAELMRIDPRRTRAEERVQLHHADVAIVISPQLGERWTSLGFERPITVVPNGVDTSAYRDLEAVPPAPGIELEGPVAGLVGQLSSRIDIALLESVVAAGCSLLMVGPWDRSWEPRRFPSLLANPRVRWVGSLPFEALPSFLKHMDVGLTPYLDTPFNRASFPLKTLEYLAAGKPVVSTDLPAVKWLGTDLITVADHDRFGGAAWDAAMAPSSQHLVARRVAFAEQHSWARRALAFAEAIGLVPVRTGIGCT